MTTKKIVYVGIDVDDKAFNGTNPPILSSSCFFLIPSSYENNNQISETEMGAQHAEPHPVSPEFKEWNNRVSYLCCRQETPPKLKQRQIDCSDP